MPQVVGAKLFPKMMYFLMKKSKCWKTYEVKLWKQKKIYFMCELHVIYISFVGARVSPVFGKSAPCWAFFGQIWMDSCLKMAYFRIRKSKFRNISFIKHFGLVLMLNIIESHNILIFEKISKKCTQNFGSLGKKC